MPSGDYRAIRLKSHEILEVSVPGYPNKIYYSRLTLSKKLENHQFKLQIHQRAASLIFCLESKTTRVKITRQIITTQIKIKSVLKNNCKPISTRVVACFIKKAETMMKELKSPASKALSQISIKVPQPEGLFSTGCSFAYTFQIDLSGI